MKNILLFICGLLIIFSCQSSNPVVEMKTELGSIFIELYPEEAPVTVKNFLKYINENRFEGAVFYRVVTIDNQTKDSVKIQVIQGGN